MWNYFVPRDIQTDREFLNHYWLERHPLVGPFLSDIRRAVLDWNQECLILMSKALVQWKAKIREDSSIDKLLSPVEMMVQRPYPREFRHSKTVLLMDDGEFGTRMPVHLAQPALAVHEMQVGGKAPAWPARIWNGNGFVYAPDEKVWDILRRYSPSERGFLMTDVKTVVRVDPGVPSRIIATKGDSARIGIWIESSPYVIDEPGSGAYIPIKIGVLEVEDSWDLERLGKREAARARELVGLHVELASKEISKLIKAKNGRIANSRNVAESLDESSSHEFRRIGSTWIVSFEGRKTSLQDQMGARYIHWLLLNPEIEVVATDFYGMVAGTRAKHQISGATKAVRSAIKTIPSMAIRFGEGEDRFDGDAVKRYKKDLSAIREEMKVAKDVGKLEAVAELEERYNKFRRFINQGLDRYGRFRDSRNIIEKPRKAISKAIDKTIGDIELVSVDLARHLRNSITKGSAFRYLPDRIIDWRL